MGCLTFREYFIYGLLKDAERTSDYTAVSQPFFHGEMSNITFHIRENLAYENKQANGSAHGHYSSNANSLANILAAFRETFGIFLR